MSDGPILVIKPRWFEPSAVTGQIRKLQTESPDTRVTLLAEPGAAYEDALALPNLRAEPMWEIFGFALRLRRTRYRSVVILADESRPDNGYLESKLWAFLARSRDRRFGSLKHLSLHQEIRDKWREVVIKRFTESVLRTGADRLVDALITLKRVPATRRGNVLCRRALAGAKPVANCVACGISVIEPVPELGRDCVRCAQCGTIFPARLSEAANARRIADELKQMEPRAAADSPTWKRLEARIYFGEYERRAGPVHGNFLYVGSGAQEYLKAARELGWTPYGLETEDSETQQREYQIWKSDLARLETEERFRFIMLLDALGYEQNLQATFDALERLLVPGGYCLLRIADVTKLRVGNRYLQDVLNASYPSSTAIEYLTDPRCLEVISVAEANSREDALDVWLQRTPRAAP